MIKINLRNPATARIAFLILSFVLMVNCTMLNSYLKSKNGNITALSVEATMGSVNEVIQGDGDQDTTGTGGNTINANGTPDSGANGESIQSAQSTQLATPDGQSIESNTILDSSQLKNSETAMEGLTGQSGSTPEPRMFSSETYKNSSNPYEVIARDIESIKAKSVEAVERYFGTSDVFTPETVADRVSASTISFVSNTEVDKHTSEVVVHICTIDYTKMNNDYAKFEAEKKAAATASASGTTSEATAEAADKGYVTAAKKEVTRKLIKGAYEVCYNIPVTVTDGSVAVSESFKQAITGGWYTGVGVTLTPVKCLVD